jgi:hypothetical protein
MPLSPIPSTLPTSTYEHLVLEALGEIAVGSTINYNPPILDTALFRHLVLNALQYIANNGGGGGGGSPTGSAGGDLSGTYPNPIVSKLQGKAISSTAPTNEQVYQYNTTSLQWVPTTLTASGTAGGDLSGTYPNPTVDGLQGRPVSDATPVNGQVLQYDGTNWVPGSIPSGGSGGGGVLYYLNFNTAADAPVTNIPQTPNASKELGIVGDVTGTSYQSPILSTGSYDLIASFVTDVNTPSSTTIPAGIWDFNIFVQSTTTNSANQVYFKIEILKYNGVNAPTSLATSNDVYIYDPSEINQQIASVVMPQTTILATDRIVVYLYGRAHQNNNTLTFHFGGNYPSHTHSTIPSVTGTGVAKVVNGVFQSPASTIVNADVSTTAAIVVSKLSQSTARILGRTTAGVGSVEEISVGSGLSLSSGTLSGITDFTNYLASVGMSPTAVDTTPRFVTFASSNITSGTVFLSNFTPIVNMSVTQLTAITAGTATSATLFQMGLYSYNESTNTYTKIAETANDTSIPLGAAGTYTRSFSPASTQTLTAGTRYAFALIAVFTGSFPLNATSVSSMPSALSPSMNRSLGGQTSLPASITTSAATSIRLLGRIS